MKQSGSEHLKAVASGETFTPEATAFSFPLAVGFALIDHADLPVISVRKWHARTTQGKTYAVTKINRRSVPMHVFLLGKKPGLVIDHADGNGLNNTRANLRHCTQRENMRNQKHHSDAAAPYKGIWRMKDCDRWAAQIQPKGKRIYLGLYKTAEEAARAYDAKARELFGPFARLNFPEASR